MFVAASPIRLGPQYWVKIAQSLTHINSILAWYLTPNMQGISTGVTFKPINFSHVLGRYGAKT